MENERVTDDRGPRSPGALEGPVRCQEPARAPRPDAGRLGLFDHDHGPAGGLDGLLGGAAELVRVDGQRLGDLALGEDLDRDVLAGAQAGGLERLEGHLGAAVEAGLEVLEVHRLGVRPEHLERHRLLHVRTAQLAHPHVDRHLAALEPRTVLGARTRAGALLAATRRLAEPGALAAADALARLAAAGGRLQVVEPDGLVLDLVGHGQSSSTLMRWRTRCSMPRACSLSLTSTVWPMRRRPSERSVSSWRWVEPFLDLIWVTFGIRPRPPPAQPRPRRPRRPQPARRPRRPPGRRRTSRPRRRPGSGPAPRRSTGRGSARPPRACAGPADPRASP